MKNNGINSTKGHYFHDTKGWGMSTGGISHRHKTACPTIGYRCNAPKAPPHGHNCTR